MSLVDDFAQSLNLPDLDDLKMLEDIQGFVEWQVGRSLDEFLPRSDDDIDLRNYLLKLKLDKVKAGEIEAKAKALEKFYDWAEDSGIISENPFEEYDFDRPFLTSEEIRRRISPPDDPHQREISHLRALVELAQELNQSPDIQSALAATLNLITRVMQLKTAWIFLLPDIWEPTMPFPRPAHDYALTAACGLPPGLEREERFFLCQPPDCSCQAKLRKGRLTRAVNIVQCSRLQDSARAEGDNRNLFFHASTPLMVGDKTLGLLNVATEEWQIFSAADLQFLSAAGAQVAVALERAKLFELTKNQQKRLEQELAMAHDVQASLLPDYLPQIPGFDLAAHWLSAREVAGDFYDVIELENGRWGIIVGDVSDKGAPAAMFMAMTNGLIRSHANRIDSPAVTLQAVNQHILTHAASNMFVTVFYAILDPASNSLTYASAGHDPALLRRHSGELETLMPTGPLIGLFDKIDLHDVTIPLESGDALVIYTDGVTDAIDTRMEMYERSRLKTVLENGPGTAELLLARILADLDTFTRDAEQQDDITLVTLTVQ